MKKTLFSLLPAMAALPAGAHTGHALAGSHWHATDALGFVGVGLLLVLAVWFGKGGQ